MSYKNKYLKYKIKYIELKKQIGGSEISMSSKLDENSIIEQDAIDAIDTIKLDGNSIIEQEAIEAIEAIEAREIRKARKEEKKKAKQGRVAKANLVYKENDGIPFDYFHNQNAQRLIANKGLQKQHGKIIGIDIGGVIIDLNRKIGSLSSAEDTMHLATTITETIDKSHEAFLHSASTETIDKSEQDEDTAQLGDLIPGAIETITKLVNEYGKDSVILLSKAGEKMAKDTINHLINLEFFEKTGVLRDNVFFCKTRKQKSIIIETFGITHFIDDRFTVLKHIAPNVQCFLFQTDISDEEERLPIGYIFDNIITVSGWAELEKYLM